MRPQQQRRNTIGATLLELPHLAANQSQKTPESQEKRTVITNLIKVTKDDTIGRKVANQTLQGVKKVYDLYAWDDDKAEALEKWSDRLEGLVS